MIIPWSRQRMHILANIIAFRFLNLTNHRHTHLSSIYNAVRSTTFALYMLIIKTKHAFLSTQCTDLSHKDVRLHVLLILHLVLLTKLCVQLLLLASSTEIQPLLKKKTKREIRPHSSIGSTLKKKQCSEDKGKVESWSCVV